MSYVYGQPFPAKGQLVQGQNGRLSSTRFFMNPAVDRLPSTDPRVAVKAANVMIGNNECGRAVKTIRTAMREHPDNPYLRNVLIKAYGKWGAQGRLEMAENEYNLAVIDGAADICTHNTMMGIYVKKGMLKQAKRMFDYVMELDIADVVSYKTMADAYYDAAYNQKALALITHAPPHVRGHPDVKLIELEIHRKLGNYEEALQGVMEVLWDEQVPVLRRQQAEIIRAYCWKEMGMAAEAGAEFRRIEAGLHPESIHCARVVSGRVLTGDYDSREVPRLIAVLEMWEPRKDGSVLDHIRASLEMLRGGQ
jgi:pentatricopeptide repeat protein